MEGETEPALNSFLNGLCFVSLRALIETMAEADPEDEDAPPSDEAAS